MTKAWGILLGGVLVWACSFDSFLYSAWIPALRLGSGQACAGMMRLQVTAERIETPLTNQPGNPDRGRRIMLDRERGDCVVCHAMPLPDRQFHGTVGPPLDNVGARYSAGALRLRIVDPKQLNPHTVMPAYHKIEGLARVAERYRGKPILTAQEIEDVVAYLLTLK